MCGIDVLGKKKQHKTNQSILQKKLYFFRWNHNLFFGIVSLLLCGIAATLLTLTDRRFDLFILSIILLCIGLTGLYFHLSYFVHDFGKYLEVDYSKNRLVIYSKFKTNILEFDDIAEIQRKTGKRFPESTGGMVFNQYHHTCLIMKDGRKFIFTDFITNERLQIQAKYAKQFRLFNLLN